MGMASPDLLETVPMFVSQKLFIRATSILIPIDSTIRDSVSVER